MGNDNDKGKKQGALDELTPVELFLGENKVQDRYVPSADAVMDVLTSPSQRSESGAHAGSKTTDKTAPKPAAKETRRFPGAVQSAAQKRDDLPRFMMILGVLCFVLAGVLLYAYFFSPFGPRNTNRAAMRVAADLVPGAHPRDSILDELRESGVENGEKTTAGAAASQPTPYSQRPQAADLPKIKVFVAGAVQKAGVVEVPFESRVEDAIKAAGGFSDDADIESVNLAQRLSDEDKVVVKQKAASRPATAGQPQANRASASTASASIASASAAPAEPAEGVAEVSVEQSASAEDLEMVNINTASQHELMRLRGVGPALATAIVQYREKLPEQSFQSVEQLQNVAGIGPAKLEAMRAQIEL